MQSALQLEVLRSSRFNDDIGVSPLLDGMGNTEIKRGPAAGNN